VFVKHFELPTDDTQPNVHRRLETRFIVCDSTGSIYGVTYKWRPDNSDADLLSTNLVEAIPIHTASGIRTQQWYYPSREDCRTCHTRLAGEVLGVKTRQLNRDFAYPSGVTDNELRTWNHIGLFDSQLEEAALPSYPKLARSDDSSKNLQDRARSYLDANCSHCHRPNGTVASFDARYDTPLSEQNLIKGPVLIDEGMDNASIIAPNDIWRSIALVRMRTLEGFKMPPLAHQMSDRKGIELIEDWVQSLPGRPVLTPPSISPSGGNYPNPLEVTLNQGQAANIHYTIDGSAPTSSDPVYEKPIKLTGPTVLRARAFKPSFTKSITVQQTFIIGE
jgi:mono/diheme cytochrome c family protein